MRKPPSWLPWLGPLLAPGVGAAVGEYGLGGGFWTVLIAALIGYALYVRRQTNLAATWRKVFTDSAALAASVVLGLCLLLTLADSVHFRSRLPPAAGAPEGSVAYDARVQSLLDVVLRPLVQSLPPPVVRSAFIATRIRFD